MSYNNGVQIMEDPYAEYDGDWRKEFNNWLSK